MIKGKIEKAFHDITKRYSELQVNIEGNVFSMKFIHKETKITWYLDNGHTILFEGNINMETMKINDLSEIWVKII